MSMHSYAKESEIPAQATTQQAQPHVDHSVSAQNLQRKIASITGNHAPVHRKVDPTTTVNGVAVNDDPSLEHEADVMGAQAASFTPTSLASGEVAQQEKAPNNTGLPDNLKAGIENMSGMNMDAVKVHYNSEKPAQLNALAYAQGTDIHVGPGQEQHLPHEAWHVVQQGQLNLSEGINKKVAQRLDTKVATKAKITWKKNQKEGDPIEKSGYNAERSDGTNEQVLLANNQTRKVFEGKTEKENWSFFHCAEPNALAKAVEKLPEKAVIKQATIEEAIVKEVDDFPKYGHRIDTVKPRCKNCKQWIAGTNLPM